MLSLGSARAHAQAQPSAVDTIAKAKTAVVAVGTYEPTRTPAFVFRGTAFAVGDGTLLATNAHVLPTTLDPQRRELFGFLVPGGGQGRAHFREAKLQSLDPTSDLALLKVSGPALPALQVGDSASVKEGQDLLFTGFPIGAVLGPFPATHRAMVSAIPPMAIPQAQSSDLNPQLVRRLASGNFLVFQLDATAYPGQSGSPLYDPRSGEVLGVVNMVLVKDTKEGLLSQPSGIAYAVPAEHLKALLDKVK